MHALSWRGYDFGHLFLFLLHRKYYLLESPLHIGNWCLHWGYASLLVAQHCFSSAGRAFAWAFFAIIVICSRSHWGCPTLIYSSHRVILIFLNRCNYALEHYLGFILKNWFDGGNGGRIIIFFILNDRLSYCCPYITCASRFHSRFLMNLILIVATRLISHSFQGLLELISLLIKSELI